jgi:lipid II:glycine glycyltransferase (peptidoglycan interpeptide bridge formation enzyme)
LANIKLVEINNNQKNEYNRFIMDQPTGSFLQSWEWGMWQEECGHKAYRFLITNDYNNNDNITGAVQLLKMPIMGKKYYLYAPYGPVVRNQKSEVRSQIIQELKSRFPGVMFVRVEPKMEISELQSVGKKTLHIQPINTLVLDLEKTTDQLLKEMHPKTRYNIKLAQKHNVEVVCDLAVVPGYGLYWSEALKLIMDTAGRQNFKTFAASYYEKLLDFFVHLNTSATAKAGANSSGQSAEALAKADAIQNHSCDLKVYVYRALYQKELLAAAVMVDFGNVRTYLFGGSSDSHREVMAPHLLHFKAIEDAKTLGLKIYDFWGLETLAEKNPGFARFKLGFGGEKKEYAGAYDLVFNQGQYNIYKALRFANRLRYKLVK